MMMKRRKKREKTDMENNNNNNSGNNFFSGFLIGALVGAAVVFLLGTKKGKKLLKAISEGGQDNISNILEEASKTEDSDETYEEETEDIVPKREFAIKAKSVEKPKARRFFRGISRRLN